MSELSGFDSEAVGFDSVTEVKRTERSNATQTSYSEMNSSSQTTGFQEGSTMTSTSLDELTAKTEEQYNTSLNDFLNRVVPSMLQQLDRTPTQISNIKGYDYNENNSSDSDEDEVLLDVKLFYDINTKREMEGATGDYRISILSLSWSSAGNSLAISIGQNQHEDWCEHDGLIKIYTLRNNKFIHSKDISEKNCVTAVKFHHSVAAMLAYGTISGDVVICNLRDDVNMTLTSPSGCHGSRRVTGLLWADGPLTNLFMIMYINATNRRRSATDQVLISSGSDGTMNVWKSNAMLKTFENVVCYEINGSKKTTALNITCFDFIKVLPLRPSDEKVADDIFVAGTNSGHLYLCKIKPPQMDTQVDPVYEVLEAHKTCVLDVAFSLSRPGVFVSISMDSEMRVYHIDEIAPTKVFTLDIPITCMAWLPHFPCVVIGAAANGCAFTIRNVASGRAIPATGLACQADVTVIDLAHTGAGMCRVAAGDSEGHVKIYDVPTRCIKLTLDDMQF